MERWAAVCGADEVRTYRLCGTPPVALEGVRTQLCGARALCYYAGTLLCATGWGDMLWELDARTLTPLRIFPLGPGVSRLLVSPDGETLYALCEDADSVLAVSRATGEMLMLAYAGVQPRDMAFDCRGRLMIASGAACEASILCARSLSALEHIATPGICVGVGLARGMLCTLSMTEQAGAALCLHDAAGRVCGRWDIAALPGGLCADERGALALCWGGVSWLGAGLSESRTIPVEGLSERAALFTQGAILCQPSISGCALWTPAGAQALSGGADACVYELPPARA